MKKVTLCLIGVFCMLFCALTYAGNNTINWQNLNKFTCHDQEGLGDHIQNYCGLHYSNWRTDCDSWYNSMSTQDYNASLKLGTVYTVTATAGDKSTFSLKASCDPLPQDTSKTVWNLSDISTSFCNHICDGKAEG